MKKLLFLLSLTLFYHADATGFQHNFSKDGTATQWTMIQYKNYKPFPKIIQHKEKGFLHISDIRGKSGFGIANHVKKVKAYSPDRIRVRFTAKGKGKFNVGLQYFSGGRFTGCDTIIPNTLTPEWKTFELDLPVRDLNGAFTDQAMLTFYGSHAGEVFLKEFSAIREKSRYAGNLFLPKKWMVFPLVANTFVPEKKILTSIPAAFCSVKGKETEMLSNTLDFAKITGKTGMKNCSWAFAELQCPLDQYEYTFGMGADWYMALYVNGKEVLSTIKRGGNLKHPPAIDDHQVTVKLKKGRNILAVKFLSGSTSAIFKMGGPKDLRNIVRSVRITERITHDDFDSPKPRKNLTQLLQGYPAPGLMTPTGQGLYRTNNREAALFESGKLFSVKKDHFFSTGIRVQSFGKSTLRDGMLVFRFTGGKKKFEMTLSHSPGSNTLLCRFLDLNKVVQNTSFDRKKLPADLLFSFREDGTFLLNINSLADSSSTFASGSSEILKALSKEKFSVQILLKKTAASPAEILVDELVLGYGTASLSSTALPYTIDHKREFDPVKEKWPLVFSDEFSGNKVDESKWILRRNPHHAIVKNGMLHIKADYGTGKNKDKLISSALWSKKNFQYGYFEARLRFTQQPGWWAAFWLYSMANANPFMDGFEIDIFEDYYNRPAKRGNSPQGVLDHNLHINCGPTLKSWNYNSKLTGSLNDFYVLGCKWTPFEISYYLDGKLIASSAAHSPYDSVTYDAFSHSAGIAPLQVVLSGCIMDKSWHGSWGSPAQGRFPEYYLVDYVRVYAYPQQDLPAISWKGKKPDMWQKKGSILKFQADVKVSPGSKAPVKAVYLFDNGYMIAYKEKAPYTFEIPFTEAFYKTTRYTLPGRSGKKVPFDTYPHAYTLFVQDVNGKVAHTEPYYVIPFQRVGKPCRGKPIPVPGVIRQGDYDEGGQGVAYFDTTKGNSTSKKFRIKEDVDTNGPYSGHNTSGEWRNYTLNVIRSGSFRVRLNYGTPLPGDHQLILLIDGKYAGTFHLKNHADPHSWACDSYAEIPALKLEKGIRVLTMLIKGGYNLGIMEFLEK